jgi:hypothetical protein
MYSTRHGTRTQMKMLREVQNERFTFEIESESAVVVSTLERWKYPGVSIPISEDLKLSSL